MGHHLSSNSQIPEWNLIKTPMMRGGASWGRGSWKKLTGGLLAKPHPFPNKAPPETDLAVRLRQRVCSILPQPRFLSAKWAGWGASQGWKQHSQDLMASHGAA